MIDTVHYKEKYKSRNQNSSTQRSLVLRRVMMMRTPSSVANVLIHRLRATEESVAAEVNSVAGVLQMMMEIVTVAELLCIPNQQIHSTHEQ